MLEEMNSKHPDISMPEKLDDQKTQSIWMRWVLRGLLPDVALRKVLTDLEISSNVKYGS